MNRKIKNRIWNRWKLFAFTLPLSVLVSCQQEDILPQETNDIVEITASIGSTVATRVTQPEDNRYLFEKNDSVHVVGWYGGEWSAYPKPWEDGTTWWNDSKSIYDGMRWNSTPYMRWANLDDTDTKHHFLAWWPEHLASGADDLTAVIYERSKIKDTELDILVAQTSTTATPGKAVELQFDHLMARFDVRIQSFGEQLDGMTDLTVQVPGIYPDATVNLLDKKVTPAGTTRTVQLDRKDTEWKWYSGILVPQKFGHFFLTASYPEGKEDDILQCNYEIELKSGYCTMLILTVVGRDKVKVAGISVTPWENALEIDGGEAEEE